MARLSKAILLGALMAGAAQTAQAATVRAGEWETVMDGGRRTLVCLHIDRSFDEPTIMKMMSGMGVKCSAGGYHSLGPITSMSLVCDVAGGHLTTNSTITTIGMDAYTTHTKSHLEGGSIQMPDMDLTQTAHRLGECKPGDRQSPY